MDDGDGHGLRGGRVRDGGRRETAGLSPEAPATAPSDDHHPVAPSLPDEWGAVFEAMAEAVLVFDAAGNIVRANPAAVAAYGLDPTSLTREAMLQRIALALPNGHLLPLESLPSSRALRGETVKDVDLTILNARGKHLQIVTSASPLYSGGAIAGAVVVWHDVSEQLKAAEELRRSEERFRALADAVPQLVWTAQPDGAVDYINRRREGLGEFAQDEAGYLRWTPVLHPDDVQPTEEAWEHALGTGGTFEIEHRLRQADGTYRWHLSRGVPALDGAGKVVKWYGTSTDIERVKEAERERESLLQLARLANERMVELDHLKDDFVMVAAHELRTPLTVMKGYVQALLRGTANLSERQQRMAEAVERGTGRLERVVNDLLNVSRLQTGSIEYIEEYVDLAELVAEVSERATLVTEEHRIQVGPLSPVGVRGDRFRLEQVIAHLINNAIKYSPQGGDVKVGLVLEGDQAVISVADHGIGIPLARQSGIFQRFYRAHARTPFDYDGLGVGLHISREIIRRHGGKMWFESEEGKGSTFYLSLPVVTDAHGRA